MRSFLLPLAGFLAAGVAAAQAPPDRAALDRLNLKTDWVGNVPVQGRQDGVARVQVADDTQIFVQTRSGLVAAFDAFTGRTMWTFKMPGAYSGTLPVAYNGRYVFALNVAKMFILDRYRGALELEVDLPKVAAVGPVVNADHVYICTTDGRVQGYKLPDVLLAPAPTGQQGPPSTVLAGRYGAPIFPPATEPAPERRQPVLSQRTPSLTALPSVSPPYTLRPESLKYMQQTPSLTVLPTLANLSQSMSLRPAPPRPQLEWSYRARQNIGAEPVLVRFDEFVGPTPETRVIESRTTIWVMQETRDFAFISAAGQTLAAGPAYEGYRIDPAPAHDPRPLPEGGLEIAPAGPMSAPAAYLLRDEPPLPRYQPDAEKDPKRGELRLLTFLPLADGRVVAIDPLRALGDVPVYFWKAKVGGFLNRRPVPLVDGVYAFGTGSGVSRIDPATGEVDWKTDESSDTLLAVNDDHAYVRNRRGDVEVYEKGRVHDRTTRFARPLTAMPADGFNVAVTNDSTDRLYLVSDSGVIVSLREAGTKYTKPKMVAPPRVLPPAGTPPAPPMKPGDSPGDPKN